MKITKTYDWSRRDFSYDTECEHCGHIQNNGGGYDDANYYNNVVPNLKCRNCGESSNSKETTAPKTVTVPRYNPGLIM
jgi:hypothetical protein